MALRRPQIKHCRCHINLTPLSWSLVSQSEVATLLFPWNSMTFPSTYPGSSSFLYGRNSISGTTIHICHSAFHPYEVDKWVAKLSSDEFYPTLVAPSGECCEVRAHLIGLLAALGAVCFWQPTLSGLNLVVAAVLRDSVCHCCPAWQTVLCYTVCRISYVRLSGLSSPITRRLLLLLLLTGMFIYASIISMRAMSMSLSHVLIGAV